MPTLVFKDKTKPSETALFTLRPYQAAAVDKAVSFLLTAQASDRRLFVSPTGTGKRYILAEIKRTLELMGKRVYTVAPNDDILRAFGVTLQIPLPNARVKHRLEINHFYTPIRLRNLLMRGVIPRPDVLLIDEAHHDESNTFKLIDALMDGVPTVGVTATGYRGTGKGTLAFRKRWGPAVEVISLTDAVNFGYMTLPSVRIEAMMDDDIIEVKNGEFVVESVNSAVSNITDWAVAQVRTHWDPATQLYDRPTMFALPSVETVGLYAAALTNAGLPNIVVTGVTPTTVRQPAFESVIRREKVLLQIRVVSEGVDLPIRRLYDLTPMMSPVQWFQQLGRITRPVAEGEAPSEYICTNRNLLRHAYLLEGMIPPALYSKAEAAFAGPSSRRSYRVLGFEKLGKFSPVDIKLDNGTTGQLIAISAVENGKVTEYAALASPLHGEVLYARRQNVRNPDGSGTVYGRWESVHEIPDLSTGFASVPKGRLSGPQRDWYKNTAAWYGLDPSIEVNLRQFQALPILSHCRKRFV